MLASQRTLPPTNGADVTTPGLRRRLAETGVGAGQRCRICGCGIDSDPDADRKICQIARNRDPHFARDRDPSSA